MIIGNERNLKPHNHKLAMQLKRLRKREMVSGGCIKNTSPHNHPSVITASFDSIRLDKARQWDRDGFNCMQCNENFLQYLPSSQAFMFHMFPFLHIFRLFIRNWLSIFPQIYISFHPNDLSSTPPLHFKLFTIFALFVITISWAFLFTFYKTFPSFLFNILCFNY